MPVLPRVCPKCGFRQDGGEQCLRCGLVFARYRGPATGRPAASPAESDGDPGRPAAGLFRRAYRVLSWVTLAVLILVIVLILRPSPPPDIATAPDAAQRAQAKVEEFQASAQQGQGGLLRMDEAELNGWLGTNLAIPGRADSGGAPVPAVEEPASPPAWNPPPSEIEDSQALERVRSSVRDVKIELMEDSLRAHVAFELYGKALSLELEGRLAVRDGYLRLEPTAGRLGSLPLPAATLQGAAGRLFDSPDNREKFRLPPHIRDVRIEGGRLVVSSR